MGGNQASSVLLDIKLKQEEKSGRKFGDEDKKKLLRDIQKSYDEKSTPLYASARLWVDEIIDPTQTREWISMCLEVANNNPEIEKFNPGVIQT
jgi:acetyl-CoA carboxylase carboxyltransferase component